MPNNKFYITTPIYYVNAKPHIGHTYTTVLADVLARYHRLAGDKTFFLTGTDEHGLKIEEKAVESGLGTKEFVDGVAAEFKNTWKDLNISNDNFIRTTDEKHIKAVQTALQLLYDKGDIYLGSYEGLYCKGCEQFLHEKDLVDGLCPDHKVAPEKVSEESYMFRMSKYQDELLAKIKNDELKIFPVERKKEIVSFYEREGLKDVSFSRKNVKWGIPLPWDSSHTAYVWADAFLNYLTGLGWNGDPDNVPELFSPTVQVMSKDILRVHTTIWPAMLLALGLPLPKKLFIHGFFKVEGQKMSKSLGNVISPEQLIERYGVDGARYLILSSMVYGHDADISWKWLDEKYTADLSNGLGNLVARVATLMEKNEIEFNPPSPSQPSDGTSLPKGGVNAAFEAPFGKDFGELSRTGVWGICISEFQNSMENFHFEDALKTIWAEIKKCDEVLSEKQPWKMKDQDGIREVLVPVAEKIYLTAHLLKPFMPVVAEKIIEQFTNNLIKKREPLFPRINQ